MHMAKFLITGSSGFIGFHLSKALLDEGIEVIGLDGMTEYYDLNLKKSRNSILSDYKNYTFINVMLEDFNSLKKNIFKFNPEIIFHLAAQPGVRYSFENPKSYLDSNITGTFNLIEISKQLCLKHFLFASTSSIYGNQKEKKFHEGLKSDKPLSFYAATKKANEVLLYTYSQLYKIPITVMRFFTVYGPWGRPDMALFKFTKSIIEGNEIEIYNHGKMTRDFTFIDDVIKAIILLKKEVPNLNLIDKINNDNLTKEAPYRIVNIGNSTSINLMDYVEQIEKCLDKKSTKLFKEMQPGDLINTLSDNSLLHNLTNFKPRTSIKYGISEFIKWYLEYYN